MNDTTDPTVQGTQAAAGAAAEVPPSTPNPTPNSPEHPGFQKRIDELTSTIYGQRDQIAQLMQANAQLMSRMAAPPPQQEAPPPFEIDPDEARKLDYIVNRATAPLKKTIDQLHAKMGIQSVEQVTAPLGDERVNKRAKELINAWTQRGLLQQGIVTVEDAMFMAAGEVAVNERTQNQRTRDERGRFNGMNPPLTQHANPAAPAKRTADVDPEGMSIEQQVEYYEKKLSGAKF